MSDAAQWRVAWVVGASSGIGRELAILLDDRCVAVAASARSADRLEDLAGQCCNVAAFPLDITDESSVERSVAEIEAKHGQIDLAVLCAGTWTIMDTAQIDVAAVRRGVEVNYMGVVNALGALVPRMLERRSGHLVIVASIAGYRGLPKSAAYGPTKAALINLAETLKVELRPFGIAVSIVNSGFVDTPMTQDNPFPMPSIIRADEAARRLLDGIERRRYEIVFPSGIVCAVKLLRIVPNRIFFWYVRRFVMRRRN